MAISSTCPAFFMGMAEIAASLAFSGMEAVISVAIKPGAIALTVTPLEASSFATDFVIPIMPAFALA